MPLLKSTIVRGPAIMQLLVSGYWLWYMGNYRCVKKSEFA